MGQYYLTVNTAKRQYLYPHKFGDGLKLMEFGCSANGTMLGLAILLADGNGGGGGDLRSNNPVVGSWAGDPIVVAGDYATEGRFVSEDDVKAWKKSKIEDPEFERWIRETKRMTVSEYLADCKPPNLYNLAQDLYEDISVKVLIALCDDPYVRDDFKKMYQSGRSLMKDTVDGSPELKAAIMR